MKLLKPMLLLSIVPSLGLWESERTSDSDKEDSQSSPGGTSRALRVSAFTSANNSGS